MPAVARKLGRNYIGVELSSNYAKLVRARVKQALPGSEIDGPIPQGEESEQQDSGSGS